MKPRRLGPLYLRSAWIFVAKVSAVAVPLSVAFVLAGFWFVPVCFWAGITPSLIRVAWTEHRLWRRWGHPRWGDAR